MATSSEGNSPTMVPDSDSPGRATLGAGGVLVLNGFPGTGKLTILKRLSELLPADTTCLLDNHLLIDPVAAVIPGRSVEHHELRRRVREPIFSALRKRVQQGHIVLMTACLAQDIEIDAAFLREHLDHVRGTSVPLFWLNVHCDQTVLEERLGSPERCHGSKTKLTDMKVLRELIRHRRLIEPAKIADGLTNLVMEDLDVSGNIDESVIRLVSITGLVQSVAARGLCENWDQLISSMF